MAKRECGDDEDEIDLKKVELWNIDEACKAYGRNKLAKTQVENKYTALIKFISDNGMLRKKRRVVNATGKLLVRKVLVGDLTDEGFQFARAVMKHWLRSKTAAKLPADTTMLEKNLKKLRGRKAKKSTKQKRP